MPIPVIRVGNTNYAPILTAGQYASLFGISLAQVYRAVQAQRVAVTPLKLPNGRVGFPTTEVLAALRIPYEVASGSASAH